MCNIETVFSRSIGRFLLGFLYFISNWIPHTHTHIHNASFENSNGAQQIELTQLFDFLLNFTAAKLINKSIFDMLPIRC